LTEKCYFCHRTNEECREYIDGFIDDNMDFLLRDERIPSDLTLEEKKAWVHEKFNFSKFGFTTFKVESFSLGGEWKERIWFKVPVCPICDNCFKRYDEQIVGYVDDQISDLRQSLDVL